MKKYFILFFACSSTILSFSQSPKLETVVQKGHSASVKAIDVSRDGKYVVTGSRDKSAKVWELSTGREIRSYNGHEHTVNGVQFSSDGQYIATSSADNSIKVFEVLTGKEIFSSPKEREYMTDVAFSPDGKFLIAAGYNDSATIYNISSGKIVKRFMVNADQGSGYGINLDFSNDGKWMVIGEDNKTARVFKTSDWSLVYTFKPEEGWCGGCGTLVSFSNDSRYLIKLSHNDMARVYDLQTGKELGAYGAEIDDIGGVMISKDNKRVLVAGDKELRQYELNSKKLLMTIKADTAGEINEAVYSANDSLIFIACDNNVAISFDAYKGTIIKWYTGILNQQDKGGVTYDANSYWDSYIAKYMRLKNLLLLTADDKHFITGKTGTYGVQWNIATGTPDLILSGHKKAVICFDLSIDGKFLITGDADGEAILWELPSGKKIRSFKGHREPLFEVKFSPDGKSFATCSWDASVIVWDVNSGEKTNYMDMNNYSAYSLSFSPDGLYLITGRLDKTLELREPDSKEVVRTFIGHTDVISSISFGPEKYKMLSASWDGTARIWDISTGMMLQKFKGHRGAIHCAIYSADGKKVITGGDDRIIRIWDAATGQLIKTLEGHQAEITSIKVSKDGRLLISYSLDGSIKCWNLEKGIEFYEHVHVGENEWMARNKDGYFNATSGARKSIHFVRGMEVFSADQFFEEFYRPELLPDMFKSRGITTEPVQGMNDKLNQSPPPSMKIFSTLSSDGLEAEVFVKMIDEGGGVDELRLMHNGKVVTLKKENLQYPAGKGLSTVYKSKYPLVTGNNVFSASAFSKGRVESVHVTTEVYSELAAHQTVCHVFVVGIDKYKNPALSLNYAREDAEAVANIMKDKGSDLYHKVVIHSLFDEMATRKNILDTLDALASHIALHDVFVFYYAGHGSMVDNNFYFIPTDCPRLYDAAGLNTSAISATEVQDRFKKIQALKQIIIMDACQSGGSVDLLSVRGAMEEKAIAQLSRSVGIHVLASAGSEQNAKEIPELKHGLFTYVLLDALSGKADGAPNDGKITIYEIKSYLDDQVPTLNQEYSGKTQYPYTFSKGNDFPIVIQTTEEK